MREVYRSFEGKIGVDCRSGYIITELKDFYEVEFLSAYNDVKDTRVRIRKELLPESDFSNLEKIVELQIAIDSGFGDYGQRFYDGKWHGDKAV